MAIHLICIEQYFDMLGRERLEARRTNALPVFPILRLTADLGSSIGYPPLIILASPVLLRVD